MRVIVSQSEFRNMRIVRIAFGVLTLIFLLVHISCGDNGKEKKDMPIDYALVEDGIHVATGLAHDENFELVRAVCTSCHSAKLITQNRATREGWRDMIRWMQATQKLPDLGTAEPTILDYLAKHYAPENKGRRAILISEEIEWYVLGEG